MIWLVDFERFASVVLIGCSLLALMFIITKFLLVSWHQTANICVNLCSQVLIARIPAELMLWRWLPFLHSSFFDPQWSNQSTNQRLVESLLFCHRPNLSNVYFSNHTHPLTQPPKPTNHSDVRPSNVVLLPSTPFSGSVVAAKVASGVTVMLVTVASRVRVSSENSASLSSFTRIRKHILTYITTYNKTTFMNYSLILTYIPYYIPRPKTVYIYHI